MTKTLHVRIGMIYCLLSVSIVLLSRSVHVYADGAGARAVFTRNNYIGARYVAMGGAAEAIVDDIFAIYWNPAGLYHIRRHKSNISEEIYDKAQNNDIDAITEEDLIDFSDEKSETFVQVGLSGAMLDVERDIGFAGVAFNALKGVVGAGFYTVQSDEIETRDDSGNLTGETTYTASVGTFSYSNEISIATFGFSAKVLYEKIDNVEYYGGGCDIGVQTELFPLIKVGFVVQDIGTGLKPVKEEENIDNSYDFGRPVIRLNIALLSRSADLILSMGAVNKIEQDEITYNLGLQYNLMQHCAVYVGMQDEIFATGFSLQVWNMDISYAFSYDKIDYGYNNIVSAMVIF
jgi:hypothetical protein